MRAPWRPRPVVIDDKFMATNWAKRGFIAGVIGTAFCLAWIVWGVVAVTPVWWKWPYVALMVGLLWVNARLVPSNYRGMRTFPMRHAAFVADTERLARMLADAGVPEHIARRIDELVLNDRLDDALALAIEHSRHRPRP